MKLSWDIASGNIVTNKIMCLHTVTQVRMDFFSEQWVYPWPLSVEVPLSKRLDSNLLPVLHKSLCEWSVCKVVTANSVCTYVCVSWVRAELWDEMTRKVLCTLNAVHLVSGTNLGKLMEIFCVTWAIVEISVVASARLYLNPRKNGLNGELASSFKEVGSTLPNQ